MEKKKAVYRVRYRMPKLEDAIDSYRHRIKGVHPSCESVAEISCQDFDRLVESIKTKGLLYPIQIDRQGLLVDGRCRLRACKLLGFEIPNSQIQISDTSPYSIAESNVARRHLT